MSLAPELVAILTCPRCKGPLRPTASGALGCPQCRVAYPVSDDIPVMIFEETALWTPGSVSAPDQG